jgi:hypothetical protein
VGFHIGYATRGGAGELGLCRTWVQYPGAISDAEAASTKADLDALKALQADASGLDRMESLLDRFNVFEAIGFDKDEVIHSNLLAFLLDPKRNDGLGDLLIKEVLRETFATAHRTLSPSVFEDLDRVLKNLDSADLGQPLVRREHEYIDVLLTNEEHSCSY